jgi:hypothetical protein
VPRYLRGVYKKFDKSASSLNLIAAKNGLLYPTGDGMVCFKRISDVVLPLLEAGYIVGRENTGVLVSFQYQQSNGEVAWFGRLLGFVWDRGVRV